jgi:hypothetical protein
VFEVAADAARTLAWQANIGTRLRFTASLPLVFPKDHARHAAAAAARPAVRFCGCLLGDCAHMARAESPIRAVFMVHVAYYVDPSDIARAIQTCRGGRFLSIEHDYRDAAGTHSGGAVSYHIGRDGYVHASAIGDPEGYTHPLAAWRFSAGTDVDLDDGVSRHLVRSILESFGDTHLCEYYLVDGPAPVARPADGAFLGAIASEERAAGPDLQLVTAVNRIVATPGFDIARIPISGAYYLGGMHVLARDDGQYLPIPKGLIASLATVAAGKPRDAALYALLLARGRRICGGINMPDDIAADAIVYAAAAALARVDFEVLALGRTVYHHRRAWDVHRAVLGMAPVSLLKFDRWTAATALSCAPSAYYSGAAPAAGHAAMAAGSLAVAHPIAVAAVIPCAVYAAWSWWSVRFSRHSDEAQSWASTRAIDGIAPPTSRPVLHLPGPAAFPGILAPKTARPNIDSGARVVANLPAGARDAADDRAIDVPGLRLHGLAFSTLTPSMIPRTDAAAIAGLTSRLLADLPPQEMPGAWDKMSASLDGQGFLAESYINPDFAFPDDPDELWEPFISRFPAPVRATLTAARNSLRDAALARPDFTLNAIVKREKTGSVDPAGVSLNDPRIVLDPSARFNAYVSPVVYHWSLDFRARHTIHSSPHFFFAISTTAEELGDWFDHMSAHYSASGVVAYGSGDMERFDAKQRAGALAFKLDLMRRHHVPPDVLAAINDISHPRGAVQGREYIRFKGRKARQISGGAWTTAGNCAVTGAAIVETFGPPGPASYSLAIAGDDFFLIGRANVVLQPDTYVNAGLQPLGLSATYAASTDTADAEFVSLIPYPTEDGTIFGPKIGR